MGEQGVYNRQDLGLARALANAGHDVFVVRPAFDNDSRKSVLENGRTITEYYRKCAGFRTHSLISPRFMDDLGLDAMIMLGDIQISVPYFYNWCRKRGIIFWPYVGTLKSNSDKFNKLFGWIGSRNISVYQKCHCIAKTPAVRQDLYAHGVKSVSVMPVGLDTAVLTPPGPQLREKARREFGFDPDEKVICFVGSLMEYKRPLKAVRIFAELRKVRDARLLVVGDGPLREAFERQVSELGLTSSVTHVLKLTQLEMWKAYCASDLFINLNELEIFGMALMEALYYSVPVVATVAPGPLLIMSQEDDGVLIHEGQDDEFLRAILLQLEKGPIAPRQDLNDRFSWNHSLSVSDFPWPSLPAGD